jgi:hypothetical protein
MPVHVFVDLGVPRSSRGGGTNDCNGLFDPPAYVLGPPAYLVSTARGGARCACAGSAGAVAQRWGQALAPYSLTAPVSDET